MFKFFCKNSKIICKNKINVENPHPQIIFSKTLTFVKGKNVEFSGIFCLSKSKSKFN